MRDLSADAHECASRGRGALESTRGAKSTHTRGNDCARSDRQDSPKSGHSSEHTWLQTPTQGAEWTRSSKVARRLGVGLFRSPGHKHWPPMLAKTLAKAPALSGESIDANW